MSDYRKQKTSLAMEFQDFVAARMKEVHGITITITRTKQEQYDIGESHEGYEIKYDMIRAQTGRLYIETEERREIGTPWVKSGIYRNDNSRYIIIGDYDHFWVFPKVRLQQLAMYKRIITNNRDTSKGFLMDLAQASIESIYEVQS